MAGDWTQIYLYIAGQTYKRWNKGEMPADIAVDSISDYQVGELNRLKAWLYRQRIRARIEKDKVKRRQENEKVEMVKKAERPVLFEF